MLARRELVSLEAADILTRMTLSSEAEIEANLASGDWRRDGQTIAREYKFEDFGQAIAFVNLVADAAERQGHHPDILVHGWNKVRLSLTNHSAGGLTEADFAMAAKIDQLG